MKPSRPPIRWHSLRPEDHPDAGRSRERRGEKGNLRHAPKALRRTVDEGREKCRCVTELTTRRGGPSVHGRSLYDKIVGQRAKVRSVGYPSRGTANRILIEALHRRLKVLRPLRFNADRSKCRPRGRRIHEQNVRSSAGTAKILRMLRNFPRFAGFWFG
jgi:hypothetical protein